MQHMVNSSTYVLKFVIVAHNISYSLGLGIFTSPFVATQFAQLPRWSFNFLVSLGIAIINVIFLVSVFKLKCQDGM